MPQQVAVDDAHGTKLDDRVARRRVQAGGFGVKHRIRQFREQPVVQRAGGLRDLKQIKIVKLGSAVAVLQLRGFKLLLRARQWQQETKKRFMSDALTLKPHLATM